VADLTADPDLDLDMDLDLDLAPDGEPPSGDDDATDLDALDDDDAHRGGFGEFGGEARGLIDRTFRERIILVGVIGDDGDTDAVDDALDELAQLVDTAGADPVARVTQRRHRPDPATFIGQGKATEIGELADALDVDTVVFDDELSPGQQFNLERIFGRSALDRTAVILDIFAQNASSIEGRTQVELAQLQYRLPRIGGRGRVMSQQGAGIGTRGPGETQLEVDRRKLLQRIKRLERQLRDIAAHRETQRKARRRSAVPQIAIVGYTNAGKSTLLNHLTDAGVLVEDRLFATLDSTTRRLALPSGESVLLTDTVGFVRKLPHQLVEAFASTLEVTSEADLLLHVVDGSSSDPQGEIDAVREVLDEVGAAQVPQLLVVNKADRHPGAEALAGRLDDAVAISARTGAGVDELLRIVDQRIRTLVTEVSLEIPWTRGDVVAAVHRHAEVMSETPGEHTVRLVARMSDRDVLRFEEFQVDPVVVGPAE
jgi:GTP-binding protein HflX